MAKEIFDLSLLILSCGVINGCPQQQEFTNTRLVLCACVVTLQRTCLDGDQFVNSPYNARQ